MVSFWREGGTDMSEQVEGGQLHMNLTDIERAALTQLKAPLGVATRQAVVRRLIRDAALAQGLFPAPKGKTK